MFTPQSPHYSNSHNTQSNSKINILNQISSPTYRNKRIPSAQDNYPTGESSSSNPHTFKYIKTESPSKFQQKLKRRKSQYINTNSYQHDHSSNFPTKKKSSKSISHNNNPANNLSHGNLNQPLLINNQGLNNKNESTGGNQFANINNLQNSNSQHQNILNEMNILKNQYKQLKSAYQGLMEEKINNVEKIVQLKQEKRKIESEFQLLTISKPMPGKLELMDTLKFQVQGLKSENVKLKQKHTFYEQELDRIKKQCYKMLEAEKFKCKKLEQSLKQKQDQIRTLNQSKSSCDQYKLGNEYDNICGGCYKKASRQQFSDSHNSASKLKSSTKQNMSNQITPKMNHLVFQSQRFPEKTKLFEDEQQDPKRLEDSLFISQEKGLNINTNQQQSQFISISLTSVTQQNTQRLEIEQADLTMPLQQSKYIGCPRQIMKQLQFPNQSSQTVLNLQNNKKQYIKIQENNYTQVQQVITQQIVQINSIKTEKQLINPKKIRKQVQNHQRLQIHLNNFETGKKDPLLSLRTPVSAHNMIQKLQKKSTATKGIKNSKSKRKEQDKENRQWQPVQKNMKKNKIDRK